MRKYKGWRILLLSLLWSAGVMANPVKGAAALLLNGEWQMGFSRKYDRTVQVPSIAANPARMGEEVLWYKKQLQLPPGNWTVATLELKGARFQPAVYINGEWAGQQEGGMAPVFFLLNQPGIKPGNTITLEIALASLKNVPQTDASYIPGADHWRSNISSGLWDDVVLHVHGATSIDRIIPFINYKDQTADIQFDLNGAAGFNGKATLQVLDQHGRVLISKIQPASGAHGAISFAIAGKLKSWSPQSPHLYNLQLTITDGKGKVTDESVMPFGVKSFEVRNKHFFLNNQPFVAKGPTVVWHRWVRSKEGTELGYDTAWFVKNIIQRSKDLGANYLRFHLGKPPERFLDLCDRYGLVVQYEWSFFHGMPASQESLVNQYKYWLDLAMRHPSVSLIHPYNETGGDQLKTVWAALDQLLPHYPPLVLEDRDVLHVHKYWWSMFENVGLYYDDAAVFPKAVMADEFGGNYLDEKGDPGGYPSLKESYLRFLGRTHTVDERLTFQAQSNARIAEYWRRIGAAGFSPFCSLGSYEDGNTWFMGPLKEGKPKPVWAALAAAFSPQSVSIELWDKDFEPAQHLDLPVYLFNDAVKPATLSVAVTIENRLGKTVFNKTIRATVAAFSKKILPVALQLPQATGDYIIKATLLNKPPTIRYPVVSEWDVRVFKATVPDNLQRLTVAVPAGETELKQLLQQAHITTTGLDDTTARAVLTSLKTWQQLATGNKGLAHQLLAAIERGKAVVMLDAGDRPLGQGYPSKAGELGPLQSVARITNPAVHTHELFSGIYLTFTETAEPESFLHPDRSNRELWNNLPARYTGIWNGLRGGLNVPAAAMEFSGLSAKAFVEQWKARGADEDKIKKGPYYAYELQGFYGFSDQPDDQAVQKQLKEKVQFLVQDAPALANAINPLTPVAKSNLFKAYQEAGKGIAENFVPLANCAKNLTQTPVALVQFGPGKGVLLVSQLLTAGRLAKGFGETGLYGIRYDEVAVQYVLNMISLSVKRSI